jgi:DNA-directed RNA polymerase specialized sigma24 family protein
VKIRVSNLKNKKNMKNIEFIKQRLQKLLQVTKKRPFSDEELREFVLLIQELGTERKEKLKWLNKLIDVIQRSEKLTKLSTLISRRGCFYATTQLKDLYADALGDTFLYIAQNIDDYDPTKNVMAWVNATLNWKFLTAFNKNYRGRRNRGKSHTISLDKPQEDDFCFLEILASEPCEAQEKYRLLREFVLSDPEGILKARKTTNDVTLQDICLMLLDGKTWKEIADEFQISLSTAERFFKRNMKKSEIWDYFHRYLR